MNIAKAQATLESIANEAVEEAQKCLEDVIPDSTRYTPGTDNDRAWRIRRAKAMLTIAESAEAMARKLERVW